MKHIYSLMFAILALTFVPAKASAGDVTNVSSQDSDWDKDWGDDDDEKEDDGWGDDDDEKEDDGWGDNDDDGNDNKIDYQREKYLHFSDELGVGIGGDLRVALVYAYRTNDGGLNHRLGFDLAAGVYTEVWNVRFANYLHFETAFSPVQMEGDQYRFGLRNDVLWHSKEWDDLDLGGSFVLLQFATISPGGTSWNPEMALTADYSYFWLRLPIQFYAGYKSGVGFGPTFGGSFK